MQAIRSFILHHQKRHPREMGVDEIRQYLSHLAIDGTVASSTQNVALCALLFLYRQVLAIDLPCIENIERAKRPKRVPVVFTAQEVRRVLANLHGNHLLMASLHYGAGLGLMECIRLRVKDLDFQYKQITVRDGKGETRPAAQVHHLLDRDFLLNCSRLPSQPLCRLSTSGWFGSPRISRPPSIYRWRESSSWPFSTFFT